MRFVARSEWDLLMTDADAECGMSLNAVVFLIMTWCRPVIWPTVVALCIDIRLAILPARCQSELIYLFIA